MTFARTDAPEPRARRRKALLERHPEIRALFGRDVATAWVTLAILFVQLGVTALAARIDRLWSTLVLAYAVGAVLNHWLAMSIHETSHHLVFKRRIHNRLLALIANVPGILPMAMSFHRYHVAHHRLLGVEHDDTDLPLSAEVSFIGPSKLLKLVWLFFYMFVYAARGASFAKRPDRWELLNIVTQTLATYVLYRLFGLHGIGYLALSTFFGLSLHPVAAHFIHEHYTFQPGQETYSYYGPLNWVTFNVGYHVEHHDFMNIPGSRLPELHRIARRDYGSFVSHRSWTWVLWHFITGPMTAASRIVRSRAVYERGRGLSAADQQ